MRARVTQVVRQTIEAYLQEKVNLDKSHYEIAILLTGESNSKESVWRYIDDLSKNISFVLAVDKKWSEKAENFVNGRSVNIEEVDQYELLNHFEKMKLIYLPVVNYNLLAKVALTLDDDLLSWLVIQMQLKGKKIIFANDLIQPQSHVFAPTSVKKRIYTYTKEVKQDGIHLLPQLKVTERLLRSIIKQPNIPLLLEKHVEAVYRNGAKEITIDNESLITPLGKDRAHELGITIERGE